jgi:predicted ATPase
VLAAKRDAAFLDLTDRTTRERTMLSIGSVRRRAVRQSPPDLIWQHQRVEPDLCHVAIEQLARAAGVGLADDAATKLAKLEALTAQATTPEDVLPYLIDLLGLPPDGRYALPPLTPQERKSRTFRALLAQLEGLASRSPVLLALEDAHWCDPTTLERSTG